MHQGSFPNDGIDTPLESSALETTALRRPIHLINSVCSNQYNYLVISPTNSALQFLWKLTPLLGSSSFLIVTMYYLGSCGVLSILNRLSYVKRGGRGGGEAKPKLVSVCYLFCTLSQPLMDG